MTDSIKTKKEIIQGINYIINRTNGRYSRNVLAFLKVLYSLPGAIGTGISYETFYQIYINAVENNVYGSINKTTPLTQTITIEDTFTIMWLMWMDGIHDNYIKDGFISFLNSRKQFFNTSIIDKIIKLVRTRRFPSFVKTVLESYRLTYGKTSTKFVDEKLIPSMVNNVPPVFTTVSGGKWERVFKQIISRLEPHTKLNYGETLVSIDPIYVGIDQETNIPKPITSLVNTGTNIFPFITPASMYDPGRGLVTVGNLARMIVSFGSMYNAMKNENNVKQLKNHFLNAVSSLYLGELSAILTLDDGIEFMNIKMDVNNNFDYVLQLNGKPLELTVSAGAAGKLSASVNTQMSKYFGDFLQLLYIIKKSSRGGRLTLLGTGDANFTLETYYYRKLFGQNLNLIIDSGQELTSQLFIYGKLHELIENGTVKKILKSLLQAPQRSGEGGEISGALPVQLTPTRNTRYNANLQNLGLANNTSKVNLFTQMMVKSDPSKMLNSKFNKIKNQYQRNDDPRLEQLFQRFITAFRNQNIREMFRILDSVYLNVPENVQEGTSVSKTRTRKKPIRFRPY